MKYAEPEAANSLLPSGCCFLHRLVYDALHGVPFAPSRVEFVPDTDPQSPGPELPSGGSSAKHEEMSPLRALDGLSSKVDMILSRLRPDSPDKGEPDAANPMPIRSASVHPEMTEAMRLRDELIRLRDERRQHMAQRSPSITPYESQPTLAVSPGGGTIVRRLSFAHFIAFRGA